MQMVLHKTSKFPRLHSAITAMLMDAYALGRKEVKYLD